MFLLFDWRNFCGCIFLSIFFIIVSIEILIILDQLFFRGLAFLKKILVAYILEKLKKFKSSKQEGKRNFHRLKDQKVNNYEKPNKQKKQFDNRWYRMKIRG